MFIFKPGSSCDFSGEITAGQMKRRKINPPIQEYSELGKRCFTCWCKALQTALNPLDNKNKIKKNVKPFSVKKKWNKRMCYGGKLGSDSTIALTHCLHNSIAFWTFSWSFSSVNSGFRFLS